MSHDYDHDDGHDLMSRLVDYHDHIAAPPVLIGDDLRRGRRRVRRTRGLVAGGVALGLATVVVAVSLSTGEQGDDVPQPAERPGLTTPMVKPASLAEVREFGFHVEPGSGYEVSEDWSLTAEEQALIVRLADDDVILTNDPSVSVAVYYQGEAPELPTAGAPVTVHGDGGTYVEETEGDGDYWRAWLTWEYAPGSWAQIFGRGFGAAPPPEFQSQVLSVAEALRSGGGEPVRVPVRVGTLPPPLPSLETGHRVNVYTYDGEWTWWLEIDESSIWATSDVEGPCLGSDDRPQTAEEFTYRGIPGCLVAGERIGLRLGDVDVFFDFGEVPDLPLEDMKQALAELTVASDDPATWFSLQDALAP